MSNEYKKTISKERLLAPKDANNELTAFMLELFRVLGYEMTIVYRDDKDNGQREVKATWEKLKPKTKADLLRAMTDEELAKTMNSTGECPPCECPYAYADLSESGGNITDKQCVECWLEWLKQEAKDA